MARKKTIPDDLLLNTAREVFVEKGFAASTREIARRAGVSEGLLFRRYRTKADLFFASMTPPLIDLKPETAPAKEGQFLATLLRLGFQLLDYFRAATPVLLPLMSHPDFRFEEFAGMHPDSPLVAMRVEAVEFFAAHRVPDPAGAALVLMASMHGIAMFEKLGAHGGRMPTQMIERAISCIYLGVNPHPLPRKG